MCKAFWMISTETTIVLIVQSLFFTETALRNLSHQGWFHSKVSLMFHRLSNVFNWNKKVQMTLKLFLFFFFLLSFVQKFLFIKCYFVGGEGTCRLQSVLKIKKLGWLLCSLKKKRKEKNLSNALHGTVPDVLEGFSPWHLQTLIETTIVILGYINTSGLNWKPPLVRRLKMHLYCVPNSTKYSTSKFPY